jgi:Carboxypeptidase regulatory-like domain
MRVIHILLILGALASAACHPGPVIGAGERPAVGGTIAGIVSTDGKAAVPGRKVTAINTETGAQFDATTGTNGGYTIKVPEGTYRLEVELRAGETVAKHPAPTRVNKSDLDPRRDFVITGVRTGGSPMSR